MSSTWKQLREQCAEIGAIGPCAGLEEVEEDVAGLEDPGVVGEQAEHEPHEEAFQVVAPVARCVQRVMELADDLGCHDVRRVLIAEGAALNADDEAEGLHLLGEFRERRTRSFRPRRGRRARRSGSC